MSEDESDRTAPTGRTAEPGPFAQLVQAHYSPALRYAARLLHHEAEAEDCVQEAFAEVFAQLHRLQDISATAGWIRGIVRHRCLRRLRRRDLELLPDADLDLLGEATLNEPLESRRERLRFAQHLLELLPAHEHEIVTLFYFKECSQQEIASFLGLPLSTVNNRLHDARERMKRWEKPMHTTTVEPHAASDRLTRIGTLVNVHEPFVEARFDPDAALDLFDALAIVGSNGQPVERMKVCRRLGEGRVQCLLTGPAEPLSAGMTVLNTGQVGVALSPRSRVEGVSPEHLLRAVEVLREPAAPALVATGIKAIDLFCPLSAHGVAIQVGMAGVGRIVLLDELAQRIGQRERLTLLCLVERTEADPYRGWDQHTLQGAVGGLKFCWALSDQATDPQLAALSTSDAALYLSPLLAVQGLYPALDAEHCRSKLLRPEIVGAEHCQIAERARAELVFAKRAQAEPEALELLACRAFSAARRRLQSFRPQLDEASSLRLARARKLQLFLTQPFGVAMELTGWPSSHVSVEDMLAGCRAILDGELDALPEAAFAYAGNLAHVHEHVRANVQRRYH